MSAIDHQVGGRHYKDLKIQPVQYIMANMLQFCEGNVVKYVTRYPFKGGVDDLRKARHYVELIRENLKYCQTLHEERLRTYQGAPWRYELTAQDYNGANALPTGVGAVVIHITDFANTGRLSDLDAALKWVDELIAAEVK